MDKDYYEPMDPKPINESGEVPGGQTGTYMPESRSGGTATEQMQEKAEQAQEKMGQAATMGRERADQGITKAASGLHSAADQLRQRSEGKEGMQGQVGTKAADALEKTSSYLKERDSQQIWDDVESFVRENPMQAAAGALVAGFILGRMLR
ncbi:MAG: hypothetical protein ACM3S1_14450 [Hyphomicrobiales bacterium]